LSLETKIETRGRKPVDPEDRIRSGLFESQWKLLKIIAKRRRTTVAQVTRDGIAWYLAEVQRTGESYKPTKEEDADFEQMLKDQEIKFD